MPPRIVERCQFAGLGIVAGCIRSFVTIAVQTGEREVPKICRSAMLAGADMIDRECDGRIARLWNATILIGVPAPAADGLGQVGVDRHLGFDDSRSFQRYLRE